MANVQVKDPQAVEKYTINWADWLIGSEVISTSVWAAADVTVDSDTNDTTTATVTVSGGTEGETNRVTNTITTDSGRTNERSVVVRVETK